MTDAIEKAGRVLSGANMKKVRDALGALKALLEAAGEKEAAIVMDAVDATMKGDNKDKAFSMLSQQEVAYTPLSMEAGRACANCKWFKVAGTYMEGDEPAEVDCCHLVEMYPEAILPTGMCNRWESTMPIDSEPPAAPVYIVAPPADVERAIDSERYISPRINTDAVEKQAKPGVSVFKADDGGRLMLIVASNSFKDRENERVLQKALEDAVNAMWTDDGKFIGALDHRIWHIKGLPSLSDLLYANMHGAFLVTLWQEREGVPLAKAYYDHLETTDVPHGASIGFRVKAGATTPQGEFEAIKLIEVSTLPLNAAANIYTFSGVLPMADNRKAYLADVLKRVGVVVTPEQIDKGLEEVVAELAAAGIRAKSNDAGDESAVNMAALVVALTEDLAEVREELAARKTADAQADGLTKALTDVRAELAEIRKELSLAPRAASRAAETLATEAETETVKNRQSTQPERDPFWS